MPPRNPDLPRVSAVVMSKRQILSDLAVIDADPHASARILELENGFRVWITSHLSTLPVAGADLRNFNTSPFVLMIYARSKGYTRLSEIENDILPAKVFSSMETSAGRMVETVALPVYDWQPVLSSMHTANSALDGKQLAGTTLKAATLKSGPRCLNDEMSENFADNVVAHGPAWLAADAASALEFTYGVLYGTKRQSNKKDWHILRKIAQKLAPHDVIVHPRGQWEMEFTLDGAPAKATVRIGLEWWTYLGGPTCLMEICIALIRACVSPGAADRTGTVYAIADMDSIVCWPAGHGIVNVAILQASQLPWLFFLMHHFCDELAD